VAEIKIPDNIKFHTEISIVITPEILPSQRCAEWLLLPEHGCCCQNMAAALFAPLPIHTAGCRVFLFPTFSFSERQRIRRYAIRARVDVVL